MVADKKRLDPAIKEILKIGGILCAICASVAFLLSFVNAVTLKPIAENEESLRKNAVVELFGSDTVVYSSIPCDRGDVQGVFVVSDGGAECGYFVSVTPFGFGGRMELVVALDPDGAVLGVKIISHSETPGLGDRIESESFLSQFVRKGSEGAKVDVIAGSTISSRAVAEGVSTAVSALSEILTGGVEN